ncbi:MAG: pyruvate kinase [Prochlorotrichaceae cyanobacterium]|jgi:pyruvate kinase
MKPLLHRTKIVATIGPASRSPEVMREIILAGMSVARLNFSHGSYADHAQTVASLRQVSRELDTPITLLQDLQGPKIRVGQLPQDQVMLVKGAEVVLVPDLPPQDASSTPSSDPAAEAPASAPLIIPIDYPYLAEDAKPGLRVLLDDGLLHLTIVSVNGKEVHCEVVEGGILKPRKGVNLPDLNLKLPSLTDKDKRDLEFGLLQGIDWVSLSFVRQAEDIRVLKQFLADRGAGDTPVIAKIEKPQAVDNLEAILDLADGLMVARGDLGVEMRPEKVPLLQKRMIKECNLRAKPVITATQMMESMIYNPVPTRAEASDVANAIIDGTDAVMLSGESAVGKYPVKAIEMLARIATYIEPEVEFINNPPERSDQTHALSEALNIVDKILPLKCIVCFTQTGYSAMIAAGERPNVPVVALTPNLKVYHRLNLVWGVQPLLVDRSLASFEALMQQTEHCLRQRKLASSGDCILILGGYPTNTPQGTNFMKIHYLS